jgi:hypothetical protein
VQQDRITAMDASTGSGSITPGMTSPQHSNDSVAPSSAFPEKQAVITASTGIQPRLLASNDINNESLRPHRSRLPLSLYLLSFAPSIRGKRKDGTPPTWREFFAHPYVLYTLGTLAALPAGLAFPALDLSYGYWTTGVTAADASQDDITGRGDQVGWIMTIVGFTILFLTWAFLACCEFFALLPYQFAETRHLDSSFYRIA